MGRVKKEQIRADGAGHGVGVEDFLIVGRRFFGGWFGEFGRARIFVVIVSFPLAFVRRSGGRRRDGLSRVRVLF
jgi:hypothetical protein